MSRAMLFDMIRARPSKVRYFADTIIGKAGMLSEATPFVFDDDAVRTSAALREEMWRDVLPDAALLPFDPTWVEYNPRVKLPEWRIAEDTAIKTGHLVYRDHANPHVIWVTTYDSFPDRSIYQLPYACCWSDDGTPVSMRLGNAKAGTILDFMQVSELKAILLTGRADLRPPWMDRFGGVLFLPDKLKGVLSDGYKSLIQEHASVPSLLMAMLAILSVKGREEEKVPRSTNRIVVGGTSIRGSAHTVVRIKVPLGRIVKSVRAEATSARKRWHMVREHPRTYHRGTSLEFTIIVHSHPRGDESLGKITHDYVVKGKK